jgi:hypothetical protein
MEMQKHVGKDNLCPTPLIARDIVPEYRLPDLGLFDLIHQVRGLRHALLR